MNTDIIALAKKAGFEPDEHLIFTHSSSLDRSVDVTQKLERFATLLEAEIRKEFEARITDLEDALYHIKKIAGMARVPTKRLDWIEARASMALLNEPWDKDYKPLPKNANSSRNAVRHLTEQNTKLMEAAEKYKKSCEMLERLYVNSSALTPQPQSVHPDALEALKNYQQADESGVMVLVSRQALDEAIRALIEPLSADEHKEHQDKDHDLIALRASRKVMALNNEPVMPTSQLQARIQCIIYDAIKELP